MAELECAVDTCAYYKEQFCCKGDIMVGGKHADNELDTCCESFHTRNRDAFSNVMDHPYQTISIDCEATKCTYNAGYRCYADAVSIQGGGAGNSDQTLCATFKEK